MRFFLLILLMPFLSYAFTIDSYFNELTILSNGDVKIYEKIEFNLESQYSEGFRSIRKEEIGDLNDLEIQSVKVNGINSQFKKQIFQGNYELVWFDIRPGRNTVELEYTINNKVELYDDFAKVCIEHFGANWPTEAKNFKSVTYLPESSNSKEIHYEIYSEIKGKSYIENQSIIVEIPNVPMGNFVGGCYLFDKENISGKKMEGSAKEILDNEREKYGSIEIGTPSVFFCLPIALLSAIFFSYVFITRRKPKYDGSILPPDNENPIVVGYLVNRYVEKKNALASIILDLIDKGNIEIFETFKEQSDSKERTLLKLLKKDNLNAYEQKAIEMIFYKETEVDLDSLSKEINKINSKENASNHPISNKINDFDREFDNFVASKNLKGIANDHNSRIGILAFGIFALIFIGGFFAPDDIIFNDLLLTLLLLALSIVLFVLGVNFYIQPKAPKTMEEQFEKWDAFKRGIESSRIKEYPPSSVTIWNKILVYATILGLAKKVDKHFSELDNFTVKRMEKLEKISSSSSILYTSAYSLSNLSRYGNRNGFSKSSSGGWSSSGGGGFSGGSSGGGGFR